jgi:hypothetical protein
MLDSVTSRGHAAANRDHHPVVGQKQGQIGSTPNTSLAPMKVTMRAYSAFT